MEDDYRHKGLRKQLTQELREKGITSQKVLQAINEVPRHLFFENIFINHAYQDKAFPIGEGQTISQPYTVAYQSQHLDVHASHKVLEIGTGSGYQASVLYKLGARIYSVERHRALFNKTTVLLQKLGFGTIKTFCGDGTKGLGEYGPYDRIIVTAGAPNLPDSLIDQLKIGGKIIIPIGNEENQKMYLFEKTSGQQLKKIELDHFQFVPLIGESGW